MVVVVWGEQVITDASFGDYHLHIERDTSWMGTGNAKVRLLHQSRQVYSADEGAIPQLRIWKGNELVTPDDAFYCEGKDAAPYTVFDDTVEIARDITGDGVPELLLTEEPAAGGNSENTLWTVFSLAPLERVTGELSGDADGGKWGYLPGQRLPVFDTVEGWNFLDINKCSFRCISTRVLLRYRDGAFRIAEEMRKAKPSEGDLAAMAQGMQGFQGDCPGGELPNQMLDLMFRGNEASAFRLYDQAWPGDSPLKRDFRSAFITAVQEIESCRDLVHDGLLGGEPVKCKLH